MILIDPVIQRCSLDVHGILIARKIMCPRLSYFPSKDDRHLDRYIAIWRYNGKEIMHIIWDLCKSKYIKIV